MSWAAMIVGNRRAPLAATSGRMTWPKSCDHAQPAMFLTRVHDRLLPKGIDRLTNATGLAA
jgi:hypothetical protein